MAPFKVYLLFSLVPNVGGFFCFLAFMLGIFCIVWAVVMLNRWHDGDYHPDHEEDVLRLKAHVKIIKNAIASCLACIFIASISPSQKEMAFIYFAPKIAANQDIQRLPSDIVKLIEQYIKPENKKDE
jgi:hypothetical protein